MNKKIVLISLLLALLLFQGCLQIMKSAEKTTVYEYRANGSVLIKEIYEGRLENDTEEWEEDCTKLLRERIDSFISDMNSSRGRTQDKEKLAELDKAIEVSQGIRNNTACRLVRDNLDGVFTLSIEFSPELIQKINDLNEEEVSKGGFSLSVIGKKLNDGSIEVRIPVNKEEGGIFDLAPDAREKAIKIKVEGNVIELEPKEYEEEDGYYIFRDPGELYEDEISLKYAFNPFAVLFGGIGEIALLVGLLFGILLIIILIVAVISMKKKPVKKVEIKRGHDSTPKKEESVQKPVEELEEVTSETVKKEKQEEEKASSEPLSEDDMELLRVKLMELLREEMGTTEIELKTITKIKDAYMAKVIIMNKIYLLELDSKLRIKDFKKV
ncbi:MAG: hypothetical protein ABIE23_02725 [archaeon]|nr:hypothetical protein [Candidatus Micrarchaeota archaeon]